MVQWLRLHTPNERDPGSIPGQETGSHMPQLRARTLQLNVLHATSEDWRSSLSAATKTGAAEYISKSK